MVRERAVKPNYKKITHVGVVVKDLEKTIERLNFFGIKPFKPQVLPPLIGKAMFRGEVWTGGLEEWSGWIGDIELELLKPTGGASPHQEFLDHRGEGFHHIAMDVDDLDKEIEKLKSKGLNPLFWGYWEGGGFAYFDIGIGDFVLELMQRGLDIEEVATPGSNYSNLIQVAVVVRDLDETIKRLSYLGFGQFGPQILPPMKGSPIFNGKPPEGKVEPRSGWIGDVELELLQTIEGTSPYTDFLERGGEGIHHIAFGVDDLDMEIARLRKKDLNPFVLGYWQGGGYAYFDIGAGNIVLELMKR